MSQDAVEARPELLAPAGDWDALRAAVANGADAVYFGLGDFNARRRAANFTVEELSEAVAWLHGNNVLGYVTFNTLVFPDELPLAGKLLAAIAEAGADAVIVQDLGVARLVRRLAPSLPIHASTQMTLTEPRGIAMVRELGIGRVILARELSLSEIRRIAESQRDGVELEVFVHGALCISVSGQCLASLTLGGRSANRGLCAQPCRLPYELIVDGEPRESGGRAFPLSPLDLAASGRIGELVRLGVRGFKIEGRLKSAHYVAAATRVYRAALDAAIAGRPFARTAEHEAELAQGFSRGFSHGFLDGVNHQQLVPGHSSKGRGLRVGTVAGKTGGGVVIAAASSALKPGDGIVFVAGDSEQEQGGRILTVRPMPGQKGRVEATFHRGTVRLDAVAVGSVVWKTDDPAIRSRLEQTWARDVVVRPAPVDARVRAALGEPLRITLRDDRGTAAEAAWEERPLERAEKHPLSLDLVREHLGRLGGTPFQLRSVEADALDPVMVPKSVLNDLRRRAAEALLRRREEAARHPVAEPAALEALRLETTPGVVSAASRLCVLVRTPEQLGAVLGWAPPEGVPRPALVWCDFHEPHLYAEASSRGRAAAASPGEAAMAVGLATPRIIKPGEERFLEQILAAQPDAVLVRNLASLSFFRERAPEIPLVGDHSLNAANGLAAGLLLGLGLARLVPSYDLDAERLADLLGRVDAGRFEIVEHQHVPMFHTQHCLFAAALSKGKDHRGCGRACSRRLELRGRTGVEHPVVAEAGCRNTVFSAAAQSAAERVPTMQRLGVRHFRVEMLRETAAEAAALVGRYARIVL